MPNTSRKPKWEFRAIRWSVQHPGMVAGPASLASALGVGVAQLGVPTTGGITAGAALGLAGWYRGHPDSFDTTMLPRLRAWHRRWLTYVGSRWRDILDDCGLTTENRRTGELVVPRILKVRSASPSIDTIHVRINRGQTPELFEERATALANALLAERVAVVKVCPQVVALVVERENPFTDEAIPPVELVHDIDGVDLSAIELGDTEHGQPWTQSFLGQHLFVAGATGSGKGSLLWSPLRGMAPLLRAGVVKPDVIDLKEGMETEVGADLFHRRAIEWDDAVETVELFRDEMKVRQAELRSQGKRKFTASAETPLRLLQIDELGMLTAYGPPAEVRGVLKLLAEIMTQGRAAGFSVAGYVQEPTKDTVPVRELFTARVCLSVTSQNQVDMVLGDGMRLRGALADEIPLDPAHAGIGFVVEQGSRNPLRVRASYQSDQDIRELVQFVTQGRAALRAVA
ncbi:DNA segregation ATPase FtsK/SpoIIIE, S-DNA-T family [Lentzea waywayandensis]|uniref:DNA segregation ATPase FtsK/SpoIIIE, S-DNA-T family n=1 Tax=Lentzea waywayandensis TaxID=84724 RepID=A0A1I6FHE1_9PSEU|nr:FtsK/SpoIIIE domain-containing protein [Lentzea waywayandensis]SFR29355.1 DNA segregation ATPase FtsK/SpoIIIE, S-DNA-T family [Lentzea waywayandensis]